MNAKDGDPQSRTARRIAYDKAMKRLREENLPRFAKIYGEELSKVGAKGQVLKGEARKELAKEFRELRTQGRTIRSIAAQYGKSYGFVYRLATDPREG